MNMETVQGRCPACGSERLFLGAGGYVTCLWIECPDPTAPSKALGIKFSCRACGGRGYFFANGEEYTCGRCEAGEAYGGPGYGDTGDAWQKESR